MGRAVASVATWIGIVFLAKDSQELPQAIEAWGLSLVLPDRETLLIAFSGALVAWVVWRDIRPVLRSKWPQLFGQPSLSIEFDPGNRHSRFWHHKRLFWSNGDLRGEGMACFVRIVNNTGRTIRDVSGEVYDTDNGRNSRLLFERGDTTVIDIPPKGGEFAMLFIIADEPTAPSRHVVRAHGMDVAEVQRTFILNTGHVPPLTAADERG